MIKSLFLKVSIISFFIISNLFVGIAHATFYTSGQIITNDYVKELDVSAHDTETVDGKLVAPSKFGLFNCLKTGLTISA